MSDKVFAESTAGLFYIAIPIHERKGYQGGVEQKKLALAINPFAQHKRVLYKVRVDGSPVTLLKRKIHAFFWWSPVMEKWCLNETASGAGIASHEDKKGAVRLAAVAIKEIGLEKFFKTCAQYGDVRRHPELSSSELWRMQTEMLINDRKELERKQEEMRRNLGRQ